MVNMLDEINEIPEKAALCWQNASGIKLPLQVPYLGMGSSYFAPLAFKFMGLDIQPEIAAEYFNYQAKTKQSSAVILSQSGKSSEALWCADLFQQFIAVSNVLNSDLCQKPNVASVIDIMAGHENYSSSKTYVNTLLCLFKGFGMETSASISVLTGKMIQYEQTGKWLANEVFKYIQQDKTPKLYITGSGPNISTALEAALILSESTKLAFHGLPLSQYDHGPKETAADSLVIQIMSKGHSYERTLQVTKKIREAGATVYSVEEPDVPEQFSILNNIVPFNYMAHHLSQQLKIETVFSVGAKVTEVD